MCILTTSRGHFLTNLILKTTKNVRIHHIAIICHRPSFRPNFQKMFITLLSWLWRKTNLFAWFELRIWSILYFVLTTGKYRNYPTTISSRTTTSDVEVVSYGTKIFKLLKTNWITTNYSPDCNCKGMGRGVVIG